MGSEPLLSNYQKIVSQPVQQPQLFAAYPTLQQQQPQLLQQKPVQVQQKPAQVLPELSKADLVKILLAMIAKEGDLEA